MWNTRFVNFLQREDLCFPLDGWIPHRKEYGFLRYQCTFLMYISSGHYRYQYFSLISTWIPKGWCIILHIYGYAGSPVFILFVRWRFGCLTLETIGGANQKYIHMQCSVFILFCITWAFVCFCIRSLGLISHIWHCTSLLFPASLVDMSLVVLLRFY